METGDKRTQRDYSQAFKLSVVEQVEKGELTYKQAQRRYGIQGRSTVLVWLRKHGVQDWANRTRNGLTRLAMEKDSTKPQTPEQRIKELEAQLKQANEKASLFEAIIDVLKKDYGVSVVKKPLGKSSRKNSSKG
jgi:transposase-like protein